MGDLLGIQLIFWDIGTTKNPTRTKTDTCALRSEIDFSLYVIWPKPNPQTKPIPFSSMDQHVSPCAVGLPSYSVGCAQLPWAYHPKIALHEITSPKITSSDITSSKITSPTITSIKITAPEIASCKIESSKIAVYEIASPKIACPKIAVCGAPHWVAPTYSKLILSRNAI